MILGGSLHASRCRVHPHSLGTRSVPRKSVENPVIIYEFRPRPESPENLEDFNPFRSIWSSPRITVRRLIAQDPNKHTLILACLGGIYGWLDGASKGNIGDYLSLIAVLALCIGLGALSGIFNLYAFGTVAHITGNWMGGVATPQQLRTCWAWTNVTAIVGLPIWLMRLTLFGEQNFTTDRPIAQAYPIVFLPVVLFAIIDVGLLIWAVVASSHMVAEVQKFESAWLGLGNMFLTGLILLLCMLPIYMIAHIMAA